MSFAYRHLLLGVGEGAEAHTHQAMVPVHILTICGSQDEAKVVRQTEEDFFSTLAGARYIRLEPILDRARTTLANLLFAEFLHVMGFGDTYVSWAFRRISSLPISNFEGAYEDCLRHSLELFQEPVFPLSTTIAAKDEKLSDWFSIPQEFDFSGIIVGESAQKTEPVVSFLTLQANTPRLLAHFVIGVGESISNKVSEFLKKTGSRSQS